MSRGQRWGRTILLLVGAAFLALLLLPLVALITSLTPGNMATALRPGGPASGSALDPLRISLQAMALVLVVTVAFGSPLAWTLARARFPYRQVGETLLLVPLAMPPLVLGLLLVAVYGPYGVIGAFFSHAATDLVNSFWALCIAQLYEAAPFYVVAATAAFAQVDRRLEHTAWLLGCGPWPTFWRVIVPLAGPGLAVALALAVVRTLGAFGAVLVIAYHPVSLPMAVWLGLQEQGLPQSLPIAAILLAITLPLPILAALWGYRAQRRADLSASTL